MSEIKIIGEPPWAKDYEFIVAYEREGKYYFWEAYTNGWDADKAATECKGIVFHNVRIQGKRRDTK